MNSIEPKVELPDGIGTKATVIGKRIFFVSIAVDSDMQNPTDDDEVGTIYSFSNRHNNFLAPDSTKFEQLVEEYGSDLIPLSYFEHSLCRWFVANSGNEPADMQWDGVRFAGVWHPDAGLIGYADEAKEAKGSPERMKRMREYAEQACESYTMYCNGDGYGYQIAIYDVRLDDSGEPYDEKDDYRRDKALDEDQCYGFLGHDHVKAEVEATLTPYVTKYK